MHNRHWKSAFGRTLRQQERFQPFPDLIRNIIVAHAFELLISTGYIKFVGTP